MLQGQTYHEMNEQISKELIQLADHDRDIKEKPFGRKQIVTRL